MGMHTEVLTGRTQQKFFNPDEAENFYYFGTYDVDFNKRTNGLAAIVSFAMPNESFVATK